MRTLFAALVTLLALPSPSVLATSSCVAFDVSWNLLAFGFNGKDFNAGTSDKWASGSATDITATGRPPFNGTNTQCYLAEFFNAIYVLGADTSRPSDIYIYDATAQSWSVQPVTAGAVDMNSYSAILDHDTNEFWALSHGEMWSLNMSDITAGASSALGWLDQGTANITTTNYDPVMAIAQNHIFFFGVPGVAAGSTSIFVIHFNFWQPDPQPFGSTFPDSHGQAVSFFLNSGVQQEIAFIPDDGSKTYILNVESNTTQTAAGPPTVDAQAKYFASLDALVQLTSSGAVSWLPFNPNDTSANADAKWSTVQALASVASSSPSGGGSSSSGGSSSGTSGGSTGSGGSGGASGGAGGTNTASGSAPSKTGAATRHVALGSSGVLLGLLAVAFTLL